MSAAPPPLRWSARPDGQGAAEVLVITFAGEFGVGSEGNANGALMTRVLRRCFEERPCPRVVFDLRELDYVMSNGLFGPLVEPLETEDEPERRRAVVASPRCREGLLFLDTIGDGGRLWPIVTSELEEALAFVRGA